ncbi:MAG: hypothetical protein M1819_004652 [Sarea resinae]|nr:MAG: hypothetical protein M1819_004652 [Sarea resinae]
MSTSSGVNVLRYSALITGVLYGVYHQASLSASAKVAQIDREYKHKEALIAQAKEAWVEHQLPPDQKTASGHIISDPNDSRFDLEAWLVSKVAQEAKK